MYTQQFKFDFMDHHFSCSLSLKELKGDKNNVAIYRLEIEVSPTSCVISAEVYRSNDGELLIIFDKTSTKTSFGIFSAEISTKIKEELKTLDF